MTSEILTIEQAWKSNNFVIVDTETTGLRYPAEIVSVAILDFMGDELLHTLVKPRRPIPADATEIHGITNADVAEAPTWLDIRSEIWDMLTGKTVIVYNADFDRYMFNNSDQVWDLNRLWAHHDADWLCAMKWYAAFYGDWNEYHQSYRWQKLASACMQQHIRVVDAHDALADCKMTYALIRKIMTERAASEIIVDKQTGIDCQHVVREILPNGDIECRDCGKTWTI